MTPRQEALLAKSSRALRTARRVLGQEDTEAAVNRTLSCSFMRRRPLAGWQPSADWLTGDFLPPAFVRRQAP